MCSETPPPGETQTFAVTFPQVWEFVPPRPGDGGIKITMDMTRLLENTDDTPLLPLVPQPEQRVSKNRRRNRRDRRSG